MYIYTSCIFFLGGGCICSPGGVGKAVRVIRPFLLTFVGEMQPRHRCPMGAIMARVQYGGYV